MPVPVEDSVEEWVAAVEEVSVELAADSPEVSEVPVAEVLAPVPVSVVVDSDMVLEDALALELPASEVLPITVPLSRRMILRTMLLVVVTSPIRSTFAM